MAERLAGMEPFRRSEFDLPVSLIRTPKGVWMQVIDRVCPECGAERNEPCIGRSDRQRQTIHRSRRNIANKEAQA